MKVKTSRPKAALAAFFAAILLLGLNQVVARAGEGGAVQAVQAAHDIKAGQVITAQDIEPVVIHGKVTGLATQKDVLNKVAVYDLAAGQLLMQSQVGNTAEREGLKTGEVGMRVAVDLVTSAGVVPGDRVDVLVSGKTQGQANQQAQATVQPLVYNIRVVNVVNNSNEEVTKPAATAKSGALSTGVSSDLPAAVELALTPAQAEQLALSEATAKLILVIAPWPENQAQGQGFEEINPPASSTTTQGQAPVNQPGTPAK